MNRRSLVLGSLLSLVSGNSRANEFARALAGDRFSIEDENYVLADILAPSAYSLHSDSEPYASSAKLTLAALLAGQRLSVKQAAPATRWGEKSVYAFAENDPASLQEKIVRVGAARVSPQTDRYDLIARLLKAEQDARVARRGLWGYNDYRIYQASNARGAIGGFHLVEGVVIRTAKARSRFYLNFGDDFREDFTASASSRLYRKWRRAGFDFSILEGKAVRIRGHVATINGPSIDLKHPLQIEHLEVSAS